MVEFGNETKLSDKTVQLSLIWWGGSNFTACWYSLNNLEGLHNVTWHFEPFSNISLDTFTSNLVTLTCPSLQIFGKMQMGIFPI